MYYQSEAEKKERRKIIAVTIAAVVLILVLIVAIIVVATKKSKVNVGGENNASFSITNEEKKDEEAEKAVVMHRLYNPNSGEHFYTANDEERDHLVSLGWIGEDIGWYSDDAKGQAVLRVYNPNAYAMGMTGSHHYTADPGEAEALVALGWIDEQIGWYGI